MLQEVKVDPFEVKGETDISSRLIQTIKKNQVEILDLNDTIYLKKKSPGGISNRTEMTEESLNQKIDQQNK